ncbi:MAG: dephospho-CoA kinase [Ruminococcaceae bacterium]|nr:dephospho-CoA kinase [Oscillospiraceae bacterium]
MKIIGVTGPTGSGKTLLTEYFASLNITTINADELYHSMLIPPSACLDAIREKFGDEVFSEDGELSREKLGRIVFNDKEKLDLLNDTVLGIVLDEIRRQIAILEESGNDFLIIDAPTLIESGFHRECDTVISIIAPKDERIKRISLRDNIPFERATERVRAQKEDSFYIENSHEVIYNDSTEFDFIFKIKETAKKYLKI